MVLERVQNRNEPAAVAAVGVDNALDNVEIGRGHRAPMQYRCFLPRI
ncbi:MAG: hypothetical protein BWX69_03084 [Planctomycetes bacterium ADurb.Bin069]|nr:MAG: hypothetical protein BWX69_03084 [Planctomycetes bacterium ADurb.Bin069]